MGHVKVSLLYTDYAVSDFSWIYLSLSRYGVCSLAVYGYYIGCIGYYLHLVYEKYYHLHEEYLSSLKNNSYGF